MTIVAYCGKQHNEPSPENVHWVYRYTPMLASKWLYNDIGLRKDRLTRFYILPSGYDKHSHGIDGP
jgi:hypothetical protein